MPLASQLVSGDQSNRGKDTALRPLKVHKVNVYVCLTLRRKNEDEMHMTMTEMMTVVRMASLPKRGELQEEKHDVSHKGRRCRT